MNERERAPLVAPGLANAFVAVGFLLKLSKFEKYFIRGIEEKQ